MYRYSASLIKVEHDVLFALERVRLSHVHHDLLGRLPHVMVNALVDLVNNRIQLFIDVDLK